VASSRWSGKTLGGRYQIEDLLGQGGMSAVYKATDPNLNRAVGVKLIHPHLADDAEFVRRFRKEAAVVAQLRHPNIVQVFDFNRDGDDFYMVMEFVDGETLRERLNRLSSEGTDMPLADVLNYAINICEAVDYAHQSSLIHRDIKPANIMLNLDDQVILMDFGIAKIMGGPQYTATGATVGTALTMSPEQIRGEPVDERSDIYAIGVVLFEMIGGQPPFQAESPMTMLMMHLTDPVPDLSQLRPDCPADLKLIVERAMAKESSQRYQSAAEMSAALRQSVGAMQATPRASTAVGPVTDPHPTDLAAASDVTSPPLTGPLAAGVTAVPPPDEPLPSEALPEVDSAGPSKKWWVIIGGLLLVGAFVLIGGLLLFLFSQIRSGDGDDQDVAEAALTEKAPAFIADIITETPTNEPTAAATAALIETPAPSAMPAPTSTLEPSPTPAPRRLGLMAFLDNEQARAGSFQLTMAEASSPASGSHYEIWISDGVVTVFLGAIVPGSGIIFTSDGSENLLALYNSVFITVEPEDHNGGAPSGEPIFVAFVPPASLDQIRLLVAAAPESPQGKAYLIGADEQARLAIDHGGFLIESLATGDLAGAKRHGEHVVNTLAGEENSAFGDLDGDGLAQNPGDGFGLFAYLERAKEHAQLAATANGASEEVKQHAEHTIIGIDNALVFLEEAIQAAGRVLASDSSAEAQLAAEALNSSLDAMLNGEDANGDGIITPSPGESGILIAYEHALKMGSFEFFNAHEVAISND